MIESFLPKAKELRGNLETILKSLPEDDNIKESLSIMVDNLEDELEEGIKAMESATEIFNSLKDKSNRELKEWLVDVDNRMEMLNAINDAYLGKGLYVTTSTEFTGTITNKLEEETING